MRLVGFIIRVVHMKLYETPALDSDVGKMDISVETSFVLIREIL
jgi:hypothetical protein